jgi:hypothetical protein
MSDKPHEKPADRSDGAGKAAFLGVTVAILAACVFQFVWALKTRQSMEEVRASLARMEKDSERMDRLETTLNAIEEKVDKAAGDQSFLVDDVTRLSKKVDDLVGTMEGRDAGPKAEEADAPPTIDWTQPTLFAVAEKAAAEYGISLTADEVRVPARFVLRSGSLEYFAVLKGGKEHETLISLLGNTPKGERRPKDFGARLNNAIQAIGFKRGKPVRFTAAGRVPPEGDTAYLFVEWEEKGETVVARAEDLIWDRVDEKPMERGKWVYVGSTFVKGDDAGTKVFAADLTGEAVATYSSPDTMFDNTTSADADDTVYLVATPRIPAEVDECTFVIRKKDLAKVHEFPEPPKTDDPKADDMGGEKPAGGGDGRGR